MQIGGKLLGFVAACSLTTLVVAGVSVATLQSFEQSLTRVESASIRALNAANFNRLAAEVTMDSRGVYASADRAEAAKYAAGVRKSLADMDALRAAWAPLVTEAERPLFETMTRNAEAFRALRTTLAETGETVSPRAAAELGFNDANRANRKAFQASIDTLVNQGRAEMAAIKSETQALFQARTLLLVGLALAGTLICGALGLLIGQRQIARPLRAVSDAIQRLSRGDHALPAIKPSRDEIGAIWPMPCDRTTSAWAPRRRRTSGPRCRVSRTGSRAASAASSIISRALRPAWSAPPPRWPAMLSIPARSRRR
jgi:methyl-accepting chemotaxis protein